MFSKACEYGIKAIIFIAQQSKAGERVSLKAVARETNSPEPFTAKILQQLTRSGLLLSLKGPTGGFSLGKVADKISLAEVVAAIDGDKLFTGCGLGLAECSEEKPCPLHDKFMHVRAELKEMLEGTSLADTTAQLNLGTAYLKR